MTCDVRRVHRAASSPTPCCASPLLLLNGTWNCTQTPTLPTHQAPCCSPFQTVNPFVIYLQVLVPQRRDAVDPRGAPLHNVRAVCGLGFAVWGLVFGFWFLVFGFWFLVFCCHLLTHGMIRVVMGCSVVLLMRRETLADQVAVAVVAVVVVAAAVVAAAAAAAAAAVAACMSAVTCDTCLQHQRRQQAHLFSFDTM